MTTSPTPVRLALLALAGLLLLPAAQAEAERAAFLAPGGEESLPIYYRALAVQAVARQLRSEGLDLIPRGRLRRPLRRAGLFECDRTDCADEVATVVGVDFIVSVSVWAMEGTESEPGSVAVSLVGQDGTAYSGTAPVDAADVETAALAALAEARRKQSLGPGPWLVVEGRPEGAMVVVDGTPVGVLPYRGAIAAGRHQVRVRLRGFQSIDRTVDVGVERSREHRLEVSLPEERPGDAVAGASADRAEGPRSEGTAPTAANALPAGLAVSDGDAPGRDEGGRSTFDTVGPVVLGVGGLAAIGVALYGALAPDDCTQTSPVDGSCLVRDNVPDPTGIAIWSAAGGAAVVGALLWFVLSGGDGGGGDDDEPEDEAGAGVELRLSPRDLGVTVRF
jgi:hypothetical protein